MDKNAEEALMTPQDIVGATSYKNTGFFSGQFFYHITLYLKQSFVA
jgi:hypothetical protein